MAPLKRSNKLDAESLNELEVAIEDLRVAFERYFIGIDRCAPVRDRELLDREIKMMAGRQGGNTALRFRLDGLRGRFVTYDQHWRRVLRDIENGTFKRVVAEAERRSRLEMAEKHRERTLTASEAQQGAAPTSGDSPPESAPLTAPSDAVQAGAAAAKNPAKPTPPAATPRLPDGMDAAQARSLFKAFVAAKKANGESVEGLSYAGLVNKLASEVPRLRQQHGTGVDFDVSTEGGKVRLVARLRK